MLPSGKYIFNTVMRLKIGLTLMLCVCVCVLLRRAGNLRSADLLDRIRGEELHRALVRTDEHAVLWSRSAQQALAHVGH